MSSADCINNMKTNILHAAIQLFYDNGYNATSFEQIAKVCGITKPLITHHYKTKINLANEVTQYITRARKNVITRKIYDYYGTYDVQFGTAVELRVIAEVLRDDPKAYRFYHDRVNAGFDSIFTEVSIPLYEAHNRRYNLKLSKNFDELTMCALSTKAAATALNIAYFNGKLDCSFDDFCNYTISLPFKFMNVPQEDIEIILIASKKMLSEIEYRIAPYFEII